MFDWLNSERVALGVSIASFGAWLAARCGWNVRARRRRLNDRLDDVEAAQAHTMERVACCEGALQSIAYNQKQDNTLLHSLDERVKDLDARVRWERP